LRASNHRLLVVACLSAVLCTRCATSGAVHVAPDESRPHISWEIRSGADKGDEDFVCGSAQPARPCVLAATTETKPVLATVSVFVHAAAQPTSYLGFMRVSFLEDDGDRRLGEINATVNPGSRPLGTTVVGRVTSKPGKYSLSIAIDATQPAARNPVRIVEDVPVDVR
jgi:hypothetical protein